MRVTEKKCVKIDRACKRNPVFVTWKTTLSRAYWLFYCVQTEGLQTDLIDNFEPYTTDLENSQGQIIDLEIFAQPQLVLYAIVDTEDIPGFKTLIYSNSVQVLTNPETWQTDGPKWEIYRVKPGSFTILNTDEVRTEFEITFDKPYINNVRQ